MLRHSSKVGQMIAHVPPAVEREAWILDAVYFTLGNIALILLLSNTKTKSFEWNSV